MGAVIMHRPLPTARELRLEARDRFQDSHWAWGDCWCGTRHQYEAATLALIPPPWDESRAAESSFPTAVAW